MERCDRSCTQLKRWLLRVLGIVAAEFWQHRQVFPLALAQMMLVADQPLLPTNMSAVAKEFGFDAAERDEKLGGVVSVVFFTFGALFSLLVGRLADRMSRRTLVCLCMMLGSSGSFANSQVQSFLALLCCRGAVGAATGGLIPASFALIGDMYSAEERPHAIGIMSIISGLGLSVGQALAGFLGTALGWRAPFALVGLLGWAVTALLTFTFGIRPLQSATPPVPGPQPSALLASTSDSSSAASVRPSSRADLLKPTVLCICLQGITGCVPWAVIGTFMADYLATNVHMGVPSATAVLFSFGVGCTTGTITGGKLGQYLYKKDKRLQGWLMGVTVWGGMLPMFCLFATRLSRLLPFARRLRDLRTRHLRLWVRPTRSFSTSWLCPVASCPPSLPCPLSGGIGSVTQGSPDEHPRCLFLNLTSLSLGSQERQGGAAECSGNPLSGHRLRSSPVAKALLPFVCSAPMT